MKIKTDFVLHSIGNEYVVIAVNERTQEMNGVIRLNATGAFLWKRMTNDCTEQTLVKALMNEYNISENLAQKAVCSFLERLESIHVIEK